VPKIKKPDKIFKEHKTSENRRKNLFDHWNIYDIRQPVNDKTGKKKK